tara:strand:- start:620 stop:1414 length:795 start_codon:yes stop_codon:yes gene_type:complete
MGIFKNITKTLKKAAPLIGASIGMYIGGPAGYAALGGALGGGIGSLAGGGDTDDALKAALLGGIGGYAAQGSFAQGANASPNTVMNRGGGSTGGGGLNVVKGVESVPVNSTGSSMFSSLVPESTMGKLALAGGIGALALGGEEEQKDPFKQSPYPVGRTRLGTGRIGNKLYNLDDPDERRQYFEDNRNRDIEEEQEEQEENPIFIAAGGEVEGPGTGTSDSVPARLSDGEFVLTAKAVRGAGGGDRNVGAARMYDVMSQLEGAA